jgi:chromosome segregation ATPase
MKQAKLYTLLVELQQELSTVKPEGEEARQSLEALKRDVNRLLRQLEGHESEEQLDHETLVERLREALDRFELTRPNLAIVIGNIFKILSDSGL